MMKTRLNAHYLKYLTTQCTTVFWMAFVYKKKRENKLLIRRLNDKNRASRDILNAIHSRDRASSAHVTNCRKNAAAYRDGNLICLKIYILTTLSEMLHSLSHHPLLPLSSA